MFVDEATFEARAGKGGDGMSSFRREKYIPLGGPNGGDGGRGGDVVIEATRNAHTLLDFRYQRHVRADDGRPGGSSNKTGRGGKDRVCPVPLGTLVYDAETDELLADLTGEGQRFIAARGGDGGKGNQNFQTSRNRAPKKSTPGFPGERRHIRLELKLLADVGLVGFPSVGKSTIISAISNARPKIAAYPFTTLTPNLGVVRWKGEAEYVLADIPGLIEGAHKGEGLGHQFLRHVERCGLIVHVLEVTHELEGQESGRDPIRDYEIIQHELEQFDPEIASRPQAVALNKIDTDAAKARAEELRAHFEGLGLDFFTFSAATREGLDAFRDAIGERIARTGREGRQLEWWERQDAAPPQDSSSEE
jgi:GTP-binding protein